MASDNDNIIPIKPKQAEVEQQHITDAAEHFAETCNAVEEIFGDKDKAIDFVSAINAMRDFEIVANIRQLKYYVYRDVDGMKYVERNGTPTGRT